MHQRTHFHGKLNLFCIFNGIYLGKTPHKRKLFRMFPYQFPTLIPKGIDLFSYIRSHTKKTCFAMIQNFACFRHQHLKKNRCYTPLLDIPVYVLYSASSYLVTKMPIYEEIAHQYVYRRCMNNGLRN